MSLESHFSDYENKNIYMINTTINHIQNLNIYHHTSYPSKVGSKCH